MNPAFAHLYIVNPLSGRSLGVLFSTHPPIPARRAAAADGAPGASGRLHAARDRPSAVAADSARGPAQGLRRTEPHVARARGLTSAAGRIADIAGPAAPDLAARSVSPRPARHGLTGFGGRRVGGRRGRRDGPGSRVGRRTASRRPTLRPRGRATRERAEDRPADDQVHLVSPTLWYS